MKSFKLDQKGDLSITNNQIDMVEGVQLIAQTVRQVLGTNLGEWFGDEKEGIDFYVILTKNPNTDLIQDTINTAVQQVADSLGVKLDTDNFTFDVRERNITITFNLTVNNGESAEIEVAL